MSALHGWLLILAAAGAPPQESPETATDATPETPPPTSPKARRQSDEPILLDQVVVSARRREEPLDAVPMSVTAESGESLESRGARDLTALADVTPNLVIYPARAFNGALTAFIRGIGQADPVWGIEPGVGVYIDDVYIARPQGALLDILDVDHVEVLRGPQGTLYGRNTLGGAIKFVTRKPEADRDGSGTVTVGAYDRLDAKAMLNLPLGQDVQARLAVGKFDRAGYGHNLNTGGEVGGRDAMALRAAASWQPTERLRVDLSADRYLDQSGPQAFKRLMVNPSDPAATPLDPGNYDVRYGAPDIADLDSNGGAMTAQLDLAPGHQLRAISAYREGHSYAFIDFDGVPATLGMLERTFQERQVSQEVQYLWRGDHAQGVAGLYWLDGNAGGTGVFTNSTPVVGFTTGNVRTQTLAAYANLTYPFGKAWTLELGARSTRERKTARVYVAGFRSQDLTLPPLVINSDYRRVHTYADLSPRISLSRTLGPDLMAYAQASRGFKAGTFNIRANERLFPASALPLDDESVTALEAGLKGSWQDDRIVLRAAAFENRYDDIQLSVLTPYDSDGNGVDDAVFGDFRNAGSGTMRGAEAEASLSLGRHLSWRGHAGYLDARYNHYYDAGQDIAGRKSFANAPRWTAGTGLVHEGALRGGGWLIARLDGRFQSRTYLTPELDETMAQPAYAVWNVGLEWISPQQHWRLALRGENVANAAYRVTGFSLASQGNRSAVYGPPRTWSLSLAWHY